MTGTEAIIEAALAHLCEKPYPPLLMFDYDGTLAPFVVERQQAFPYTFVRKRLEQLRQRTLARLVIVSGREVSEVRRLLGIAPPLEMWGVHGWQRYTQTGQLVTGEISLRAQHLLSSLQVMFLELGLASRVECKPASLALHWRGMPEVEREQLEREARQRWLEMRGDDELEVHQFDGGLEWRLRHWSKQDAVKTLRQEAPKGTPMAYFGDDLTDEDAFRALPANDVAVLVREESRNTAARLWLRPGDELDTFLQELLERLCLRHERVTSQGG